MFQVGFWYLAWLKCRRQSNLNQFYLQVLETQLHARWPYLGAQTSQATSSATNVSQTYLQSARLSSNTCAPPITYFLPRGNWFCDKSRASCKLRACFTFSLYSILLFLEMTIFSLLGRGLELMDSKVLRPIITLFLCYPQVVIFLNIFKSDGSFQGSLLFLPMPPLRVRAITRSKGIWRVAILVYNINVAILIAMNNTINNIFYLPSLMSLIKQNRIML